MLTPGASGSKTGSFWSGFFNPSMWPALFFRTFIAFMFAGIFGFVTSIVYRGRKATRTSP